MSGSLAEPRCALQRSPHLSTGEAKHHSPHFIDPSYTRRYANNAKSPGTASRRSQVLVPYRQVAVFHYLGTEYGVYKTRFPEHALPGD